MLGGLVGRAGGCFLFFFFGGLAGGWGELGAELPPPPPGKGLLWGWIRAITRGCSGYPGVPGTNVSRMLLHVDAFTPTPTAFPERREALLIKISPGE